MTCQHVLFESAAEPIFLPGDLRPVWFQPIVDTFERRILAHECLLPGADSELTSVEAVQLRSLAIHAAAMEARHGIYFLNIVPSSIDQPGLDMFSTIETIFDCGMRPRNIVFEILESDLARDPAHSHSIRDYLRRRGFGFAVGSAGIGAAAWACQAVSEFSPDYVTLDKRLIQNIDQPSCAPSVSKLVKTAGTTGTRVIAEGVDRLRLAENLWLLGIQFMQGRLFGDPSPHIA